MADGGDFVGSAAYIVRPRGPLQWLDPGAFGTLGVGGGFALGAKVWFILFHTTFSQPCYVLPHNLGGKLCGFEWFALRIERKEPQLSLEF